MRKILVGLCMCWGSFCYIPGPRKWDEKARPYMLAWLPTVGVIMGSICAAAVTLLGMTGLPVMAEAAVVLWLLFAISGFIHVDGYMDVNDAVMSRGTIEKKRAILKDSRCGTFAIVSFIFLVLIEFAFLYCALEKGTDILSMPVIMGIPRGISAYMMMSLKPMDTSQYSMMQKDRRAGGFLLIQLLVYSALSVILSADRTGMGLTLAACAAGTLLAILRARSSLEGMNGDIAGYGILWGEMLGIISMAII